MTLYGAVEMGGTKTDVTFGTSPSDMTSPIRVATTTPRKTLGTVIEILANHPISSVGVACFGPMRLDRRHREFGTMLFTPKEHWSGFAVYETLTAGLDVPVSIDTDVNGAALGEGRWGSARGMTHYAYVTVGTGIGAGLVVAGELIHGERHPEMGHIPVRRMEGDSHPGSCPFHGDCLEGMAAGPALEARFGRPTTWAGNEVVLDVTSFYVAQGIVDLVYTVAPERVVVGGGVSALPGFHERVRTRVAERIAGYPAEQDLDLLVAKPGLGSRSGLAGALLMAAQGAT